jgi:hypothetical protein
MGEKDVLENQLLQGYWRLKGVKRYGKSIDREKKD